MTNNIMANNYGAMVMGPIAFVLVVLLIPNIALGITLGIMLLIGGILIISAGEVAVGVIFIIASLVCIGIPIIIDKVQKKKKQEEWDKLSDEEKRKKSDEAWHNYRKSMAEEELAKYSYSARYCPGCSKEVVYIEDKSVWPKVIDKWILVSQESTTEKQFDGAQRVLGVQTVYYKDVKKITKHYKCPYCGFIRSETK